MIENENEQETAHSPNKVQRFGLTYREFQDLFPTEKAVVRYFIKSRYGKELYCHHCGSMTVYQRSARLGRFFTCGDCNNSFSIFKDTIFEKTSTDLRKWMYAIHLLLNAKKSISGCQLHRDLGGSYKTSWRILKHIRMAMGNGKNRKLFDAIVEIDESYIGGKPRKSWNAQTTNESKRGRGTKKTPVVGIYERESGEVYARVAMPDNNNQKLTGKQLFKIIDKVVKKTAIHMTDEYRGYRILDKINRSHYVIDHKSGFANGDIHTNSIESFWALLKRGIIGSYHHVSTKYLQEYINEYSWRFSNRKNPNIFHDLVKRTVLAA